MTNTEPGWLRHMTNTEPGWLRHTHTHTQRSESRTVGWPAESARGQTRWASSIAEDGQLYGWAGGSWSSAFPAAWRKETRSCFPPSAISLSLSLSLDPPSLPPSLPPASLPPPLPPSLPPSLSPSSFTYFLRLHLNFYTSSLKYHVSNLFHIHVHGYIHV